MVTESSKESDDPFLAFIYDYSFIEIEVADVVIVVTWALEPIKS